MHRVENMNVPLSSRSLPVSGEDNTSIGQYGYDMYNYNYWAANDFVRESVVDAQQRQNSSTSAKTKGTDDVLWGFLGDIDEARILPSTRTTSSNRESE